MEKKTAQTTEKEVKRRGYWEISFTPLGGQHDVVGSLPNLKKAVREALVLLRGWDYPHYPTQTDEKQDLYPLESDRLEAWIDWGAHKETWQFFKTGHFDHLLASREDWFGEDPWVTDYLSHIEPGSVIDFVNTTYTLTEIYQFLKNLWDKGFYAQGVKVEIALNNTANRKITVLSPGRLPVVGGYWSRGKKISFAKEYRSDNLRKPVEDLSLEAILDILFQFNWDDPPVEVIKKDQEKFLKGEL